MSNDIDVPAVLARSISHADQRISPANLAGDSPPIDIIWNHTLVCPWPCGICCVDAVHVTGSGDRVKLKSRGLQQVEWAIQRKGDSRYDTAQRHLQSTGRELTFEQKIAVLDHIDEKPVRLDLSGGDALVVKEGRDLLEEVSRSLGRNNVTLTVTGAGLRRRDIQQVASLIGELNFTYDPGGSEEAHLRPAGYAASNLQLAMRMSAIGVPVRAELPLNRFVINPSALERIYDQLADANVRQLLLIRLFAVGRGIVNSHAIPTRAEYLQAIEVLKNCEQRRKGPKVRLQCALRHIAAESELAEVRSEKNPCDMAHESFGLMADGTLLASPWAIGPTGAPLDPAFVLGNLSTTAFSALRRRKSASELYLRADENFGHCKIFAFQHSTRLDPIDRMTDQSDPLYAKHQSLSGHTISHQLTEHVRTTETST